ncbi:MAG: hybrid sensor histidine kinase/response regulator [Myxococcales bacterium]|nr:hybrid sensor histidine kinase/response regulator [Myxococcales bacterium]
MLEWLCDNLDLPMLVERADGTVEANAPARERMAGRDGDGLVPSLRLLLDDEVSTEQVANLVTQAQTGRQGELETVAGDRLLVRRDETGDVFAVVAPAGLATTASIKRRAAIADHTAGVSHELANALGAIAGWARLARQGNRVAEALELIEKSAETAWSVARHMLSDVSRNGSRPGQPATETIDMSTFVQDAARLLAPKAMRHEVQIRCSVAPEVAVQSDRGSLWSIVWNLAANAVEAMPSGGRVELHLAAARDKAVLTVTDNGPGMPDQVRERVFEPYFTTKGSGSGLGLAMVRRAVEKLGGQVAFHSAAGQGTSFQVTLPLSAHPVRSDRPQQGKHPSGVFMTEQLSGKFLIVEDDPALREMVSTALQMRGAEVIAVSDAETAQAQRGPFSMAVVDLLLPDQRGDHLIAALRERGVVERAVLATGTELPDNLADGGTPDAVLRKPFELEDLFGRLRDVLEDASVDHVGSPGL